MFGRRWIDEAASRRAGRSTATMSMSQIRWSEAGLATVAILLGWQLLSAHRRIEADASILIASRVENAALRQNRSLMQDDLRRLWTVVEASHLGNSELRAHRDDGVEMVLRLGASTKPLLLFSFDRNCPLCYSTLPLVRALAQERPCGLEVIGVALNDQVPQAWSQDSTGFPTVHAGSGSAWETLPLSIPSAVILIAPGWLTLRNRPGNVPSATGAKGGRVLGVVTRGDG